MISSYFKEKVYPQIKDFEFVDDIKTYDHSRKGISVNFNTRNIHCLSNFENLETIHSFRLTATQIKEIPKIATLKNLNLSGASIENLNFLRQFPNLTYLNVDSCDDLISIEDLSTIKKLEILAFIGNKKLTDFSSLSQFENLISLTITGTTSGRVIKLGNLKWIRNITSLTELILDNISTPKSELKPISELRKLKKLGIPENSKVEQIAYLSGALSKTECFYFTPFYTELDRNENLIICSKCNEPKIRLVGKGKNRVICKKCDVKLFNSHIELFNKWKTKGYEENKTK